MAKRRRQKGMALNSQSEFSKSQARVLPVPYLEIHGTHNMLHNILDRHFGGFIDGQDDGVHLWVPGNKKKEAIFKLYFFGEKTKTNRVNQHENNHMHGKHITVFYCFSFCL
jgi:hypothetical protein